jgi:hypothetical protein
MRYWRSLGVLALVVCVAVSANASAQKKPAEAFTDAAKAGPDFPVQGEYEGTVGKDKLGCQVVALGNGQFNAVLLPGGLPGAGWDAKTRLKMTGKTFDGVTALSGGGWTATVGDGKLTGKNPDGAEVKLTRVVRRSPTEGVKPPAGAVVLFDGSGVEEWNGGKLTEDKLLAAGPTTKKTFRNFKLHVEFRLPFRPEAKGQSRGNSGVYVQGRYEIQILDSFGLDGKSNECGGIYTKTAPSVNLCLPPLSWQTYEIEFRMARFDKDGKKTANARFTVVHNGVKVHDDVAVDGPTGHGRKEEDTAGPISFQNHGNPVAFRNVWLLPLDR